MLDALRERLATRAALRAVRRREVRPWPARLRARRVLIVLPRDEADLRTAWRFVQSLDLLRGNVTAVAASGQAAYVPDPFAGGVRILGAEDRDWRGLPRRAVAEAVWAQKPDVALDFSRPFSLAAAYLVGGAPAGLRVGLYDPRAEPFYDLLIAPADAGEGGPGALGRYVEGMDPPVLPFGR